MSSIQYGYRKCETHAQVLTTRAHGKSKNEIGQKTNEEGKQKSESARNKKNSNSSGLPSLGSLPLLPETVDELPN